MCYFSSPFNMTTQINIADIIIILYSFALPYLYKNNFEQFLTDGFTDFTFGGDKVWSASLRE